MIHTDTSVEDAVVEALESIGPYSMDDLVSQLPSHGWSEVFVAVDRMSRDGRLVLRRIPGSGYQVSLPSPKPAHQEVLG
jgi:hypothetical protein